MNPWGCLKTVRFALSACSVWFLVSFYCANQSFLSFPDKRNAVTQLEGSVMQIKKTMERVPGGLMVIPLLLGALCNTFFPNTPKIFGSFTGGLFTGATSILAVYYV